MQDHKHYFSFILRLWLAGDHGQPQWRASLEDTLSGERVGFIRIEELCQYLTKLIGRKTVGKEAISKPDENQ
jgi:hypothetical protein